MRSILFLITLLYIAVVLNMIDGNLNGLNETVKEKNDKVTQRYTLPNDVRLQFNKVISR